MSNIQELFIKNNLSLSLAESCSGGMMASMLTKSSGCSEYFLGSFVTYSDQMKIDVLNVDRILIEEKTSVDVEVAAEMCRGAIEKSGSDYGIAITGYAGPLGEKVGLVYGAIGSKDRIYAGRIKNLLGLSREEMQKKCSIDLLTALYKWVDSGEVPFAN